MTRWGLAMACALVAACASLPPPHDDDGDAREAGPTEVIDVALPERSAASTGASFSLSFAADPSEDPIGLEGLTSVLVALVASEGQERAAAYGARLEGFLERGRAGWRIEGPLASFESLALIVIDIALDPRLPGTELATVAERWRERLIASPDGAYDNARRWATALALGVGRPIGTAPTDAALATLNREDLVRLHRRLVRPERWRIDASEPIGPMLAERLAFDPGTASAAPRPCPAPRDASFVLPSDRALDVVAAAAPDDAMGVVAAAWEAALRPLERYPSLRDATRRADLVHVGARVVLVVSSPANAASAWQDLARDLAARGPLPEGLREPRWVEVMLGAGPGTTLSPDRAVCRR